MSLFITRTLQINPCPNTLQSTCLFLHPDRHDAILVSLLHAFPDTGKERIQVSCLYSSDSLS